MAKTALSTRPAGGSAKPARRRFTVDEYYRMAETGILTPDERVELLNGEIYEMAAMGSRHAGRVSFLSRWLNARLAARAIVRVQLPIHLSAGSEPEPDLAVVLLRKDDPDYDRAHPTPDEVRLVIEIADSSLAYDRDLKLPRYAEAGIPEVWIVDLLSNRVLVYREPEGANYRSVETVGRDGTLAPTAFADLHLPVAELLPE